MSLLNSLKNLVTGEDSEVTADAFAPEPILVYPDPRLSAPNAFIDFSTSTRADRVEILQRLNATLNSLEWGNRLGIAAPQIGINQRVCVVMGIPMFNPVIVQPKHGALRDVIEACYSLPRGEQYNVPRSKYVWVKWYDVDGNYHDEKFNELKAIVAQHEVSHLDGKCCNQLGTLIA